MANPSLHLMNCFKLIRKNNKDLDSINKNFLYVPNMGVNETKVFSLVVWDDVYRLKFERGLRSYQKE